MSRRKQNGKQSRSGIGMPLPQKMARYANLLVNDQSNTAIGGKLLSLIDDNLDQGKELLLRQAIAAAPPEAAMLLENAVRVQASSLSHLQTVEVGELTTELFAVPVIFHFPDNPVDFAVDLGLDVTAETYVLDPILSDPDWLIESLKYYGLGAEANGDVLHVSLPYCTALRICYPFLTPIFAVCVKRSRSLSSSIRAWHTGWPMTSVAIRTLSPLPYAGTTG